MTQTYCNHDRSKKTKPGSCRERRQTEAAERKRMRLVIKLTPTTYLLDIDERGEPVETSVEAHAWRYRRVLDADKHLARIGGRARWQDAEILGVRL